MARRIARAATVVIPTRADSLPLTFGEAMQLRRPVIVTDVGDLKYFTQRYGVGLVVPPASPEKLAQAMTDFIKRGRIFTGFEECVRELDIDLAADRFADWLRNHLMHREKTGEMVSC